MEKPLLKKIIYALFIVVFFCWFFNESAYLLWKASLEFHNFRTVQWSYETRRKDYSEARTALELKPSLPEHTTFYFPGGMRGLQEVAIRYFLYPITYEKFSDYIIDFNNTLKFPSSWKSKKLTNQVTVYARPGRAFVSRGDPVKTLSFPRTLIFVFLFFMYNLMLGAAFLSFLDISPRENQKIFFIATNYLVGYLLFTVVVWALTIVLRVAAPLDILSYLVFAGGLGLIALKHKRVFPWLLSVFKVDGSFLSTMSFLEKAGAVVLVLVLSAIMIITVLTPVIDWDGMSHWILKSKIFSVKNSIDLSYTHNNYYPLLWPLNISAQFVLSGGPYDQLAQWTSAILFVMFVFYLMEGLRRLSGNRSLARWGTIFFLVLSFRVPSEVLCLLIYVTEMAEILFRPLLLDRRCVFYNG